MESVPDIRKVDDVIDEHVRDTWERYEGKLAQYQICFYLGISPTTLNRMRKRWAAGEDVLRDRR